jgi:hypothetical protein
MDMANQARAAAEVYQDSLARAVRRDRARATAPAETLAAPGQLSETSRSASDGR